MRSPEESPSCASLTTVGLDELFLISVLAAIILAFHTLHLRRMDSQGQTHRVELAPSLESLAAVNPALSGVFDLNSGRLMYRLPAGISDLKFTADGESLICTDVDGLVTLLKAEDGRIERRWSAGSSALQIATSNAGERMLATHERGSVVRTWNIASGEIRREVETGLEAVMRIALSRSGDILAIAGRDASQDTLVQFWNPRTGLLLRTTRTSEQGHIWSLAASADGGRIGAVAGDPPELYVWDAATGAEWSERKDVGVWSLVFSTSGQYLLVGQYDSSILWDMSRRGEQAQLVTGEPPVSAVFTADDSSVVTAALDGRVVHWSVATGERTRTTAVDLSKPSWPMPLVFGYCAWLGIWLLADRRRRQHPERPTGRMDYGVILVALVSVVAVVNHEVARWVLTRGNVTLGVLMVLLAIATLSVSVAFFLAGLTRRFRSRLVFTVPAVLVSVLNLLLIPGEW